MRGRWRSPRGQARYLYDRRSANATAIGRGANISPNGPPYFLWPVTPRLVPAWSQLESRLVKQ